MGTPSWIKPLFIVAGLYDGLLGLIFLTMTNRLFDLMGIAPPNHVGYIQFPAMLLIIFAVMFFHIALDPAANKNLILYGILLKVAYCSVVFSHMLLKNIPLPWVAFGYFDLAFLIVFLRAYAVLKKTA